MCFDTGPQRLCGTLQPSTHTPGVVTRAWQPRNSSVGCNCRTCGGLNYSAHLSQTHAPSKRTEGDDSYRPQGPQRLTGIPRLVVKQGLWNESRVKVSVWMGAQDGAMGAPGKPGLRSGWSRRVAAWALSTGVKCAQVFISCRSNSSGNLCQLSCAISHG